MHTKALNTYEQIYATVRKIPHGKVCTYGQIAVLAGLPGQARLVGYALHALRTLPGSADEEEIPWWRVISAAGHISNAYEPVLQRSMLEAEGVAFDERDRVDFRRFLWEGEDDTD